MRGSPLPNIEMLECSTASATQEVENGSRERKERNVKAKGLLAGVGVVLLILGFAQQSAAQVAPGVLADANAPGGAPDPEKIDQIWQVDPINGQVSITIPFTTTPQGGRGPKIPFKLTYNSGSTITLQGTDYSIQTESTCISGCSYSSPMGAAALIWSPVPLDTSPTALQTPMGPWTTSGPYFNSVYENIFDQVYKPSDQAPAQNFGSGCQINGPYLYTDEEGATHDQNIELVSLNSGGAPYFQPCQRGYDESQIYGIPSATTDGSVLATYGSSITGPDGTSASGGVLRDPNGNSASLQTSSGVTTATDALGRAAFITNIPIGQRGQIPAASYYVTTTGPTGTTESYTVQFLTQQIGTHGGGSPFTLPHPDPNNTLLEITSPSDCIASITCPTGYGIGEPNGGAQFPALSSVALPNLTAYTFAYDPVYGNISKITFPTGGYVRFAWAVRAQAIPYGQFLKMSDVVLTDVYTSTGTGAENHWIYGIDPYVAANPPAPTSTVTNPDGSYTKYVGACFVYSAVPQFSRGSRPNCKEASHATYSSGGTLLASEAKAFGAGGVPFQVVSGVYDGPTPFQRQTLNAYDNYLNVVKKQESDWSQCTLSSGVCPVPTVTWSPCIPSSSVQCPISSATASWLRQTYTIYSGDSTTPTACNAATLASKHIVNKPCQVIVTDGSDKPYSMVSFSYDNNGNLLNESKCLSISGSGPSATCSSVWQTTYTYDATGQVLTKTEGANVSSVAATTQYTWTGPSGVGDSHNGYLTTITHPNSAMDKYTYYPYTGQMATHIDWNNNTTTYLYNEPGKMNRITQIIAPATTDGSTNTLANAITTYTYTDTSGAFAVNEQHSITTTLSTSVTTKFDGLGRKVSTNALSPQCTSGIEADTTYDSMGRVSSVTTPHCYTSDSTYGSTVYSYDGLGRKIQTQTLPDLATSTITYGGRATETTDPFNGTTSVQHIQQVNGLGQLTNVCEATSATFGSQSPAACGLDISGTGYLTAYTYDPLGDLLTVNQSGLGRTFDYDALSRLVCASNPENSTASCPLNSTPMSPSASPVAGTNWYTYSNAGSACSQDPSAPCTRTDARNIVTYYRYDNMARLLAKYYSTSDLASCYQYDHALSGYTDSNPWGQLTAEWQQASCPLTRTSPYVTSISSSAVAIRIRSNHDAMGRVLQDQQCLTATGCSSTVGKFVYSYNLAGAQVQSNNGIAASTVAWSLPGSYSTNTTGISAPSITWASTYDQMGHMLKTWVQDQPTATVFPSSSYLSGPTLLNATGYDPFGHLTGAQIGLTAGSSTPAVTLSRQYDPRGRENLELDMGNNTSNSSTNGVGAVAISGSEQGPAYPASSYPHTTVTVSGSERQTTTDPCQPCYQYGCPPCPQTVYDYGTVTLTVNGTAVSAYYNYGWTSSGVASALASAINGTVSGVVVTSSGSTITIRSTQSGTAKNGTGSISATSHTSSSLPDFVGASSFPISVSSSTLAGGYNTTPSVYDSGTISVTINGNVASVPFNRSSTPQSIASALNTAIQNAASYYVTAKLDGDSSVLVSNVAGSYGDWQITSSVTYDNSDFTTPSFLVTTGAMAEGISAASGQSLAYYYYVPEGGYAPNGNILIHSDYVMGDWYFTYDSLDRIASATPDVSAPTKYLNKYLCWTYDVYGNRTMEMSSATPCPGTAPTTQIGAYYNAKNQITSTYGGRGATFGYDAAGETTSDGVNNYWYDAEGRLCAVQTYGGVTQNFYDAEGARIAKGALSTVPAAGSTCSATTLGSTSGVTLNARYLVGLGGDQVTELSLNSTTLTWHSNIWLAGHLSATYDTKGLHFPLTDALGTKRVQMSALGTWEEQCTSLPFGNDVNNPNAAQCTLNGSATTADDATEHHFTGKERDAESGNDYFFARYYSSAMGRFLSPDWAAKAEPVPYAKLGDPQTLNLYGYLRNNPLGGVDADGHCGGGPNDPPCSEVKVEAKVTQQPKIEKNTPVQNSDGKVIAHGTGPTGGQLTDTVTVGGKPAEGVQVAEKNALKNTENGVVIPGSKNENPSTVPTDSNGQFVDNISMQRPAAGTAQGNNAIVNDMSTNVYTSTDKQTLTLTFPSGGTCTATSTRVMTNAGSDGQPSSTYTLRTTQPVVRDPSN